MPRKKLRSVRTCYGCSIRSIDFDLSKSEGQMVTTLAMGFSLDSQIDIAVAVSPRLPSLPVALRPQKSPDDGIQTTTIQVIPNIQLPLQSRFTVPVPNALLAVTKPIMFDFDSQTVGVAFDSCFRNGIFCWTFPAINSILLFCKGLQHRVVFPGDERPLVCCPMQSLPVPALVRTDEIGTIAVAFGLEHGSVVLCHVSVSRVGSLITPLWALRLPEFVKHAPISRISVGTSASAFGSTIAVTSLSSERTFFWCGSEMAYNQVPHSLTASCTAAPVAVLSDQVIATTVGGTPVIAGPRMSTPITLEGTGSLVDIFAFPCPSASAVVLVLCQSNGKVSLYLVRDEDFGVALIATLPSSSVTEETLHFAAAFSDPPHHDLCIAVSPPNKIYVIRLDLT